MREPNARVRPREKFELSLDGRQVASVVVVALVLLAVVFVLGLNVGKQIALRQAERHAPGDLSALDRAPAPARAVRDEALTFHDRLTRDAPPPPPPPAAAIQAPPPPAPRPEPADKGRAAEKPTAPDEPKAGDATAEPKAAPAASPEPASPAAAPTRSAVTVPAPAPRAAKPWTIQLAAAHDRAEAERVAKRFASLNPRIEEADVPGKGRFWRVRVGGFDTKDAAEKYLADVGRETGAKGFVAPAR